MRGVVALGALLVLAGCLDDTVRDDDGGDESEGWVLANDAAGCREAVGVLLVELATLQQHLPANLTAADAQGFFGLPLTTDRGVLFLNGVACEDDAAAEVAIYIEDPAVVGAGEGEDTQFHLYTLAYHTSNGTLADRLADARAPLGGGPVEVAVTPGPGLTVAEATVAGEGMDYSLSARGTPMEPMDISARFWRDVPAGLLAWDYIITGTAVAQGTLVACSLDGSVAAEVSGWSDCQGRPTAALVFPDQSWTGTVSLLAGAAFAQP